MSRFLSFGLLAGLALALPLRASAQPTSVPPSLSATDAIDWEAPQTKPARPVAPAQPAPPAPPPPPAAPVGMPPPPPPAPPLPLGRSVNVQLEFTITDQMGSAAPDKKTVSMIASDRTWARIRASANANPKGFATVPVSLNVDARPTVTQTDAIQTEITIEYRPIGSLAADEPKRVDPTILNQSLTVILQNGRPMVISQAADPVSDRKIVVEVKATVMK